MFAGCVWNHHRPSLPSEATVMRDQLVVYSDFAIPRRHRLLDEITALRADMGAQLDLPDSDEPIHVHLFDDAGDYRAYMERRHPEFPNRRAFFVESDTRLVVLAHWGDRVAEDLRHEVAHGYLHGVTPNVPLWLDEGVAEYYEVPRGHEGLNHPHVRLLWQLHHDQGWMPNLPTLESFAGMTEMTQRDYAEAWLWVHWLLHSTPERRTLLRRFLAELRHSATAIPLSQALAGLEGQPHAALVAHLQSLAAAP
jgi:hypothetical protein